MFAIPALFGPFSASTSEFMQGDVAVTFDVTGDAHFVPVEAQVEITYAFTTSSDLTVAPLTTLSANSTYSYNTSADATEPFLARSSARTATSGSGRSTVASVGVGSGRNS